MNEEEVLVGRIQDLAEQCYHRDVPSHTEFLTLAEQDLFYRTVNEKSNPPAMLGRIE